MPSPWREAAGVDVLTHVPLDRPIDDGAGRRLAAAGAVVVPTLTMMKGIVDRLHAAGIPGPHVRACPRIGARAPRGGRADPGRHRRQRDPRGARIPAFGASLHDELELLVEAGLTPVEALRAATSVAAEHFGLDDRGTHRAAGCAPTSCCSTPTRRADIPATRDIRGVWIAGERVVDRA